VIRTADVVIVGGGVTGVSIAFSLAARGVGNSLVLERRFLASGGTGRSVGILRQLYPTAEATQMVVRSLRVPALRRGDRR
jgi:sarcosine oxidase, subunit beta